MTFCFNHQAGFGGGRRGGEKRGASKGVFLVLALSFCLAGCGNGRERQEDTEMEKITVVNGAVPVYKFTIPPEDSLGNYSKLSAKFLVDSANYRKQARARAYGAFPSGFFYDAGDIFFLDFGEGDRDRNGPYLLSNVVESNRNISAVSDNAGANTWFTLEFPLEGKRHQRYEAGNFPGAGANGDFYFALGLGTGSASLGFTYYVKDVALLGENGGRKIPASGSGFEKPAFAGYPANIAELGRVKTDKVEAAEAADDYDAYYTVRQIYPWLYSIYDPQNVYCYLALGNERALLFDTAYGIGSLPAVVRKITDKPVTVVLGHGHSDHANGAYQFDEAWLHEADFDLCRLHTSKNYRMGILNQLGSDALPDDFDSLEYVNAGQGNLKELKAGQVFDLGGLHLEAVEMEGHTAGSTGLLAREHRVLLDSDAASSHVWLFLKESLGLSRYIAMLERTARLDFDTFFSGHSDAPIPKSDFEKFIRVARNASMDKAQPYSSDSYQRAFSYQEDGAVVVFNEEKLKQ